LFNLNKVFFSKSVLKFGFTWIHILASVSFFSACSFDAKYRSTSLQAPSTEVKLEYRSQPGDKIILNFMHAMHPMQETHDLSDSLEENYHLQIGDEVLLNVQDRDDLNRQVTVAPDGNIYFPSIDPIPALGKTLKALSHLAEEKYQPLVRSARVILIPMRFSGNIESMMKGLASPGRAGSSYETTIGVDGKAVFPQLGFLEVSGKTPEELNMFLQKKYREIMEGLEVTSNLTGGTSKLITLLGEVRKPGSFDVSGPISLTAALGLAEGWLPSAQLTDIILVQKRNGKVSISKYDLEMDLMVATQLQLIGGDLVFVPRSSISDLNIFVDQYLRRNLPVAVGLSIPVPLLTNP